MLFQTDTQTYTHCVLKCKKLVVFQCDHYWILDLCGEQSETCQGCGQTPDTKGRIRHHTYIAHDCPGDNNPRSNSSVINCTLRRDVPVTTIMGNGGQVNGQVKSIHKENFMLSFIWKYILYGIVTVSGGLDTGFKDKSHYPPIIFWPSGNQQQY